MKYRVTTFFTDLQDNDYAYHEGDTFPREGKTVTPDRIKELSGTSNLRGIALIEEVRVADKPEPVAEVTETTPEDAATVEDKPRTRTRKRKSEE